MSRSTWIALIVLAVIGVVGVLFVVAGLLQDRNQAGPPAADSNDDRMALLDRVLAPARREFDLERLTGSCSRAGRVIRVAPNCEMKVAPAKGAPSVFFLVRQTGTVQGCYGLTEEAYRKCLGGSGDEGPQPFKPRTRFTVAADPAWLSLSCVGGSTECSLTVALR